MPLGHIQPIDPEALHTALQVERAQLGAAIQDRLAHLARHPDDEAALAALSFHRGEIELVDAALSRHEVGLWDVCTDCGDRIDDEHLTVRPTAITCLPCGADDPVGV